MRDVASRSYSANGRNYLISYWLEEQFKLTSQFTSAPTSVPKFLPVGWFVENLVTKVDPSACEEDLNCSVVIKMTDEKKIYWLLFRGPVLEVKPFEQGELSEENLKAMENKALLVYSLNGDQWKQRVFLKGGCMTKGALKDVIWFWYKFEHMRPPPPPPKPTAKNPQSKL